MNLISPMTNAGQFIRNRRSCRAYLDTPVSMDIIQQILDIAKWAPSGVNHQPARVAVLGQETKLKLSKALLDKFRSGALPNPDYNFCPREWQDIYIRRRQACGLALYQALGISKEDKEAKKKHWENNYSFFHAPVGLIIFIEKHMPKGSWIDAGMFIQNILLAAQDFGLSTCPQAAFADYPDVVRKVLGLKDVDIICGIAIGYADDSHPLNSYRTEREEVNEFACWYE